MVMEGLKKMIKLDINPLSSEAGRKLQSFKEKVVDKKKFELETALNKKDPKYQAKEASYKSYEQFHDIMDKLNMQHIILVTSFKIIVEKFKKIHFKESADTGRLLPSQVEEFKEIWELMEELYNFFEK